MVDANYSNIAIDTFALSRYGDCLAYLLRFCILFIKHKIVDEKDLVLVKGQSLIIDKKGKSQRIVQEVETQTYRAGDAKPAREEQHFALEIPVSDSGDKILYLDPAMGVWLIRCKTTNEVLARFYNADEKKDIKYSPRKNGIYWSEKGSYDFQVENRVKEKVLKLLRSLIAESIRRYMNENQKTPADLKKQIKQIA